MDKNKLLLLASKSKQVHCCSPTTDEIIIRNGLGAQINRSHGSQSLQRRCSSPRVLINPHSQPIATSQPWQNSHHKPAHNTHIHTCSVDFHLCTHTYIHHRGKNDTLIKTYTHMHHSYVHSLQIPHWDRIHYTETVFMVCKEQDPLLHHPMPLLVRDLYFSCLRHTC